MSNRIATDFQLNIGDNQLEDFKAFVNKMIEKTALNEPNTLVYEWYINASGNECHLLEVFKDSEAFLAHLDKVGHMFDELFTYATMTRAKIYGAPSDELKQSLDPLGVEYFEHFSGITR